MKGRLILLSPELWGPVLIVLDDTVGDMVDGVSRAFNYRGPDSPTRKFLRLWTTSARTWGACMRVGDRWTGFKPL